MLCRPHNQPTVGQDISAMVCWMAEAPLRPGAKLAIKHTTRWVRALVRELHYRLDVNTLHRDHDAERAGAERHRPDRAAHDRAAVLRRVPARTAPTGSFILVDEQTNATVGRGDDPAPERVSEPGDRAESERDEGVTAVSVISTNGGTIWFTGLSGAGKSTVSAKVHDACSTSAACAPSPSTATTCARG